MGDKIYIPTPDGIKIDVEVVNIDSEIYVLRSLSGHMQIVCGQKWVDQKYRLDNSAKIRDKLGVK